MLHAISSTRLEGQGMDDLLIRGATVLDGTGGPPQGADVAVRQGRISAIEAGRAFGAPRHIDETDPAGRTRRGGRAKHRQSKRGRIGAPINHSSTNSCCARTRSAGAQLKAVAERVVGSI